MKKINIVMAAFAAVTLSAAPAMADWPNDKPITVVIPFSTGGGFDTYVRYIAPRLEKELGAGVTVVPENIGGAGGKKGSAVIARAEPDGYTFGILNIPGLTVSQVRGEELSFDPNALTWLVNVGTSPYGIAVAGNSTITSVKDLCALGRPAKFAQTGPTASAYVAATIAMGILKCEVKMITGYQGTSEALTAVMRGEVDASMRPISSTMKYVTSGDLKFILSLEEKSSLPGVEDVNSIGHPEIADLALQRMFAGPPGIPADITKRLSDALVKVASDPEFKAWATGQGDIPNPVGTEATAQKNAKLLKFYGQYKNYLTVQ